MSVNPKIIDILNEERDGPFVSLEYFPPRTEVGVKNLNSRMQRMKASAKPIFTDITWGAGGSTSELTMSLALTMVEMGHVANMHLTCTNMEKNGDPIAGVHDALTDAFKGGVRNIVALRGDPAEGQEEWTATEGGFTCALDLVKYIRKNFGNDFGISVAGYPEGHPNAISKLEDNDIENMSEAEKGRCCVFDGVTYVCKDADYEKEMAYLKEKVDAGADFIITQMFFDAKVFLKFADDCKSRGINCPVVPGLMCINGYAGFKKMTGFCKTRVPKYLEEKMDSMKDDEVAVKAFGIEYGIETSKELLEAGTKGLHFYTLNLEKCVYGIMDGLGLSRNINIESNETDAKTMAAVGSAWARTGDTVKSDKGTGVVKEIRSGGAAVVIIDGAEIVLEKGAYSKVL